MTVEYYAQICCDGCSCAIDTTEPGMVRYWLNHPWLAEVITKRIDGKVLHFCDQTCFTKFLQE